MHDLYDRESRQFEKYEIEREIYYKYSENR